MHKPPQQTLLPRQIPKNSNIMVFNNPIACQAKLKSACKAAENQIKFTARQCQVE